MPQYPSTSGTRGEIGPTGPASTITGPTGPASTITGPTGPDSTITGPTGPASTVTGPTGPTFLEAYDIYVAPNGNDTSGIGAKENPYLTINKAITQRATLGPTGTNATIHLASGIYNETISIPQNTCIRGANSQSTIIQKIGVTGATTLATMGTQTRLEDVTLSLQSSVSADLIGINYPGDTTTTSKLRTSVVNVTSGYTGASNVYGVYGPTGTTTTNPRTLLSSNAIRGTTINVTSSTSGKIRGCYFDGPLQFTMRDTNVFAEGATNVIGVEPLTPVHL